MKIDEILIVNNLVNPSKMGGELLSSSLGDYLLLRVKNIDNNIGTSKHHMNTSLVGGI